MLMLHGHEIAEVPYRVLSIDPGSGKAGYSIIDYTYSKKNYNVVFSSTLSGNFLSSLYFDTSFKSLHGERVMRNLSHALYLNSLLLKYNPDIIVSEAAFGGRNITAYRALVEFISILRAAAFNYDNFLEFITVPPPQVKSMIGVNGKSGDKSKVKEALAKNTNVSYNKDVNFNILDEHSIDSICVGIAGYEIVHADKLKFKIKSKRRKK